MRRTIENEMRGDKRRVTEIQNSTVKREPNGQT